MKFIILLTISFNACHLIETDIGRRFSKIDKLKNEIIVIDIGKMSNEYRDDGSLFREKLVLLLQKISIQKPLLIYLNFTLSKKVKGEEKFGSELKKHSIISTYFLRQDGEDINLSSDMRKLFGVKIRGKFSEENYGLFDFNGVEFPPVTLVAAQKALCACIHFPNLNDEMEATYPFHYYDQFLFEDCSLTLTNEILARNSFYLDVEQRIDGAKYNLVDLSTKGRKFIKILKTAETIDEYKFIPIRFTEIQVIKDTEFLNNPSRISNSSIIIINNSYEKYRIPNGNFLTSAEILASEISTLLGLVAETN